MGGNEKKVEDFLDKVPDDKLTGLSQTVKCLYKNEEFRLDMQGMTSDDPQQHNLQVQVNNKPLRGNVPNTVAQAQVPSGENKLTANGVRDALKAGIDICLTAR